MIANFFKKTKPIHAIFISALFLVYYILAILIVEKPLFSLGLVLKKVGFLFFFLILFFLVRFINRKNQLSELNSYVLLILAILFGIFPKTMEIHNIFYAHFFLLLSFRRIYSLKTNKNIKEKLFDSGLWVGVATLFYSWSFLFIILVFTAIFIRKKQELRNLIIPIIGYATPLFIIVVYYFMTDNSFVFYQKLILDYSFSFNEYTHINRLTLIGLIAFLVIAISIVSVKINSLKNDLKSSWILIIIHFLISVSFVIVAPQKKGTEIIMIFFPSVIISANLLQLIDKMIVREVIVLGFLAVSFSLYFL